MVEGGTLYVTKDARYLIAGSLYEARSGALVNLTEQKQAVERRRVVAEIDPARTIAFAPDGGTLASVVVFTDTDCGYCRKLHQEIAGYNERGIEVRYLAFPRAGNRFADLRQDGVRVVCGGSQGRTDRTQAWRGRTGTLLPRTIPWVCSSSWGNPWESREHLP